MLLVQKESSTLSRKRGSLNGDTRPPLGHCVDESNKTTPKVAPEIQIMSDLRNFKKKRRRTIRMPVLAGDIVAILLQGIHGPIEQSKENGSLIFQADASRRTQALKLNRDPRFKGMREHDITRVVKWAAN